MTENYYGKTALVELSETELDGASTYISGISKTDETFTVLLGWGVNKNESTRKKIEPGAIVDHGCMV